MAASRPSREPELIAQVARLARGQLDAAQAALAEAFARLYYGGADPLELAERDPADLAGAAAAHLDLGGRYAGDAPKLRVYNPRLDAQGWQSAHTVVQLVGHDMPFLVDSTTMEVNRQGLALHLVVHPVLRVVRDAKGRLQSVAAPAAAGDGRLESFIHLEVDRQTDPARLHEIEQGLARVLGDVRATVEDWKPMRDRLQGLIAEIDAARPPLPAEEVDEARAFLAWLLDNHMTLLGYRDYDLVREGGEDVLRVVKGSGLGILRESEGTTVSTSFATLPPETRAHARKPELLVLSKANARATVHRPGYLDYVGVKRIDAEGKVTGERRILGLYTHTVYTANPRDVPVLRSKVAQVQARAGFLPASHDGKALASILEDYPRDELMQIEPGELYAHAIAILQLGERQRARLLARRDTYGRFVTFLLYVPRDKYNTEMRQRFQRILAEAYDGTASEFSVSLSESPLARIFMLVRTRPGAVPEVDVRELERRIVAATRRWEDELQALLLERAGEERGNLLFARYGQAFPAGYREDHPVRSALLDLEMMEALGAPPALGMNLHRPLAADPGTLRFRLFRSGAPIALSDALPILENLGVRVIDDRPYHIQPAHGRTVWIVDFGLALPGETEVALDRVRPLFHEAFEAMWSGRVEPDNLNRLVLAAELSAREISLLRAYTRYLRQAGIPFSLAYMQQALVTHAALARRLVALFEARFDPARASAEAEQALLREIESGLEQVPSLDDDRILRRVLETIRATTRSNAFQRARDGTLKPYISLKFDPQKVPELPEPRPMFEIFVYAPRVEGVHLRGGRVARGGLRWSDRREDFRTEVLGLMKAQMVKNAVIVPVGSKGGFVVKQPPPGGEREALLKEGIECYQTFLRGLLDLTDNLVEGKPVAPPEVVRHDGDDPYLVVAADKGTASFSDIANGVAAEYGFWLGDAFASGGSSGYDHKKMGITARGAWESVKFHFATLGVDTQTTDFTVAGIGDMSGDVFGNGMLLSRHIKLVAAFDHRHIFLDAAPGLETSFAERQRLFELPRSSWADYDATLISAGGGVWPRSAKSVPVSEPARQVLGLAEDVRALPPDQLISAILAAPVDLLWNGGVGTYVKASTQSQADAGDRANDAVRIDATAVRAKVIAEGGNLGVTQAGRIEYALAGGLINTDFIDNSAGVDTSDHEVNIKILLAESVSRGELTGEQRTRLLQEMTDEVADLVLRDNYHQNRALASSRAQAAEMLHVHSRMMRKMARDGRISRRLEVLPGDKEVAERRSAGLGLTTPEFAVLLAQVKIGAEQEMLASALPDDPYLRSVLTGYFPVPLREKFASQMDAHPLRREIITTAVVNDMVDRSGTTFLFRMNEETGASVPDLSAAFLVARQVFDLPGFWAQVEALDGVVDVRTQLDMLLEGHKLTERGTRWLLHNRRPPFDIAETIDFFSGGVLSVTSGLPKLLTGRDRSSFTDRLDSFAARGVPQALAERVAGMVPAYSAFDLVEIAAAVGRGVEETAEVYFDLADRLQITRLRDRITALPRDDRWNTMARAALRDDLYAAHAAITRDVLEVTGPGSPEERLVDWVGRNDTAVQRAAQTLTEIWESDRFTVAMLSVAVRAIRTLVTASSLPERRG